MREKMFYISSKFIVHEFYWPLNAMDAMDVCVHTTYIQEPCFVYELTLGVNLVCVRTETRVAQFPRLCP